MRPCKRSATSNIVAGRKVGCDDYATMNRRKKNGLADALFRFDDDKLMTLVL